MNLNNLNIDSASLNRLLQYVKRNKIKSVVLFVLSIFFMLSFKDLLKNDKYIKEKQSEKNNE